MSARDTAWIRVGSVKSAMSLDMIRIFGDCWKGVSRVKLRDSEVSWSNPTRMYLVMSFQWADEPSGHTCKRDEAGV